MKTKIKYLLVLVLASFVFAGCATTHETKKWEYTTVTSHPNDVSELNNLGKDGWQLISVVPSSVDDNSNGDRRRHDLNTVIYIFKRPIH